MQVGVSTWYSDQRAGQAAVQPLRVATTENRIFRATQAPAKTNHITRFKVIIGSGDFSELVFNFNNFYMNLAPTDNSTELTVVKMALEKGDASAYAPVTFSGGRTLVIPAGAFDLKSDPIYPSALGLPQFARGEEYWVRLELTCPDTTGVFPRSEQQRTAVTGQTVGFYDPAVTTLNNGVDGTGAITVTGTAITSTTTGYRPMVLGRFVSGDPKTFLGIGDSILMGQGDTAGTLKNGFGFFQRAMTEADGSTAPFASINFGVASSSTDHWLTAANNKLKAYLGYGTVLVEEYNTNDLGPTGTGNVPTIQANDQLIWGFFRAAVATGKIIRTYLLPRTSSTDSWATTGNQTIATNWGPGGKSEQLNQFYSAQVGSGVDYVVGTSAVADVTEPYKWAGNGTANLNTADGLHPSPQGHITRAAELRAIILSIP